ncbi:MAG TPA: 5'-methylthioadenosine/S-adenosylhomocysteine nucleosidase [Bacteroidota bacterium]|nr:5'-methylthioadenosine/S-adenosylhomocysteine nucleosidase [Bacteroidota bacterium]
MQKTTRSFARIVALRWLLTAGFSSIALSQSSSPRTGPLVVQGAMRSETEELAARLENVRIDTVAGWIFWRGTIDGSPVIVSRTLRGVVNAAAATTIAIEHYHPAVIINQGTAGGHEPGIHLYDIVLGTSAISLGAFRTPFRAAGTGSNALDWTPLNMMTPEGTASADSSGRRISRFQGDSLLLAVARIAARDYKRGRVVDGVIGSSDMWVDELDLIAKYHTRYGSSVEDMETAAAAQVAAHYHVPFVGMRIVSDNTTNGDKYDPMTGSACQEFVYRVVKSYVASLHR